MPKLTRKQSQHLKQDDTLIQLTTLDYLAPNVGIFDEPNRCYRINNQWAKIVFGWLDWLRDERCWQGTIEQRTNAVRELARFFIAQQCGDGAMDCADLGDCLDDPAIIAILNNMFDNALNDIQPNANQPISQTRLEESLLPEQIDCDADNLFGVVTGLVDFLHNTSLDVLQIWEVITNPAELASDLVTNIPVIGQIAGGALDYANWIQDNLIETYQAAYTNSTRDQIRCGLFCNAKQGCSLSLDDIFSTYAAFATVDITGVTSLEALLDRMIAITADVDVKIVALMHWFVLSALRYGSAFYGISNYVSLKTVLELNQGQPDPDHELLCIDCPSQFWEHNTVVSSGIKQWEIITGSLTGGRIKGIKIDADDMRIIVSLKFPQSMKVIGGEISYQRVNGGVGTHEFVTVVLRPVIGSSVGQKILMSAVEPGNVAVTRCQELPANQSPFLCREIQITLGAGWQNATTNLYLDAMRFWGELTPQPDNSQATTTKPQCTV